MIDLPATYMSATPAPATCLPAMYTPGTYMLEKYVPATYLPATYLAATCLHSPCLHATWQLATYLCATYMPAVCVAIDNLNGPITSTPTFTTNANYKKRQTVVQAPERRGCTLCKYYTSALTTHAHYMGKN